MQHLRGRRSADDIPAWEAPTVGSARLPCTHTGDDPRSLQTSPKVAMNPFIVEKHIQDYISLCSVNGHYFMACHVLVHRVSIGHPELRCPHARKVALHHAL